ncbi:helix-turn-helix domain-containing protein [Nocardia paucivorans]|uniref:helix-turn-helix domain-containing protein n=1 Tax=Nocardia paucivorans TaxID=114259 RepID=UPI0002F552DC|nr:helix-turn-helix transcriptional regulator [Nocardia paucivorans]
MDDDVAVQTWVDRLLPERLHRLAKLSGAPVVFGGTTSSDARRLVIGRLVGTYGTGLHGLPVRIGTGLGGGVLRDRVPRRVDDYARTADITHEYDPIVVQQERLTSVFAVPVLVRGAVRAVLYGAVRDHRPIGDRALRTAEIVADQLRRDIEDKVRPEPDDPLTELAAVIAETDDPVLRDRLDRIHRRLGGAPVVPANGTTLAPREIEALRLVAVGASNMEIAARLGLSPQTVKTYLRSAMRKLAVHNRTAAVHAARVAGLL